MRYQGGKSRIAKPIAEIINKSIQSLKSPHTHTHTGNDVYFVSLFCGSCSVESKVDCKNKILNDNHKYLIAMLKAVQNGCELPEYISEEQYKYIKEHKDEDMALTGFVGFGCSFGGRFFEGYARNTTGTNYAMQSKKSLLKDMATLMDAQFLCVDFRKVPIPKNAIVYADPPYVNTKRIHNKVFNTDEFWNYMRELSDTNLVFISEQTAPDDFVSVWEKVVTRTLDRNKDNQFKATEKLFVHKKWHDYMQKTLKEE